MFLLGLFFISSVIAGSFSSTVTEYTLKGCAFDFEGTDISVSVGSCSAAGYCYCTDELEGLSTTDEGLGCARGNFDFDLEDGDRDCCPKGMKCSKIAEGKFKCIDRTDNCVTQNNKHDCEAISCLWLNITEKCVDSASDLGCGYYNTQSACEIDEWNLGSEGVGTELCSAGTIECAGLIFSIMDDGCSCKWNNMLPDGKKCLTNIVATQKFFTDYPDVFECSTVYDLGDCTDGTQNYSWIPNSSIISGFGNGTIPIPEECLMALNCVNGSGTRNCGEPLIRVSGFSLFSLIVAVGLIGLFYFFKKSSVQSRDICPRDRKLVRV